MTNGRLRKQLSKLLANYPSVQSASKPSKRPASYGMTLTRKGTIEAGGDRWIRTRRDERADSRGFHWSRLSFRFPNACLCDLDWILSRLSQRFFWTIASVVVAIPAFILMSPGQAAVEFANYCERKRRESTQNG
jgi:hypothetical protein